MGGKGLEGEGIKVLLCTRGREGRAKGKGRMHEGTIRGLAVF